MMLEVSFWEILIIDIEVGEGRNCFSRGELKKKYGNKVPRKFE